MCLFIDSGLLTFASEKTRRGFESTSRKSFSTACNRDLDPLNPNMHLTLSDGEDDSDQGV